MTSTAVAFSQERSGLGRRAGGDHGGTAGLEGGHEKLDRFVMVVDHQRGDVGKDRDHVASLSSVGFTSSARRQDSGERRRTKRGSDGTSAAARLATERREAQWSSDDSGADDGDAGTKARGEYRSSRARVDTATITRDGIGGCRVSRAGGAARQ
jgi:hypothetical protein